MNLARALRIQRRDVVALVGGGGKTSAMFRLGDELAAQGWRAITTTSTHISVDQLALPPHAIVLPVQGKDPLTGLLAGAIPAHTLLVGAVDLATNKAAGLPPDVIDRILAVTGVDAVINEADGARTLPLKAPADHEPVITPATTLVVPVVGVDVIGQPLDAAHVHRPERVAALTGVGMGQPVTAQLVATVLTHPQGGLKGVPPQARVVALINKVATEAELGTALHLADLLLQAPRLEAVAIGAVLAADPIRLVRSRVAVVVLAAGCSQRFGRFKQLLPWGDGTLLSHTVDVALAAQAGPVSVVLGCQANACRAALGDRPVEVVANPDWSRGQSTSVRAGLAALPENASAVLFHLADQPGVTPAVLNALIDHHAATLAPVVWPEYQGRRGNPVLFDRVTFSDLREVTGDIGAKPVLQAYARAGAVERVAVAEPGVLLDVDRPQDLDRLSPRAHRASRTLNPE